MNNKKSTKNNRPTSTFTRQIRKVALRKISVQDYVSKTVWSGLGMMGLIGWSVVLPTMVGIAIGLWIDERYPSEHYWTLILLVVGLCIGCFHAWRWLDKENKHIHDHKDS